MHPLDQFKLHRVKELYLFGLDFSFTNASISFLVSSVITIVLYYVCTKSLQLKANRIQVCGELFYLMIESMLYRVTKKKNKNIKYILSTLFIFIATNNTLAIFPFFFSTTSHISVTLCLSMISFFVVISTGFKYNGISYFNILLPKNTPLLFTPLMVLIELFTFIARPFSLAIRLAANLTAGHVVLKVLSSFILMSKIFGFLPFILLTILTSFEIFISILQAYIFVTLVATYLGEAMNSH